MDKKAPMAASPRVETPTLPIHSAPSASVTRVPIPPLQYTPTSVLQKYSKALKNERFNNNTDHRYPLRSKVTRSATHKNGTNFRHLASQQLVAQHICQNSAHHIYHPNGTKQTIYSMLAGPKRGIWTQSFSNEWGRLAQGNDDGVRSTDTIEFIYKYEVPKDRGVTYATYILGYRPLKTEPYRVRITVGGDRLNYAEDAGLSAVNLLETNCFN